VLVLDDEVTTVQQDGSSMRRITQVHLAVTTDGRDALIRNRVPSNARILQAFSVSPDGERQEASSIRGGVIRFRGLETGSRVVLQYVFHDPPPRFLPNHFVSSWLFQGLHRQLGEARWVVQVPAGRELAVHVQGPVEHAVRRGAGGAAPHDPPHDPYDVHVFTAAGVPPLVPEPAMPPARDLLAMVVLSTLTDWGEYVEWERALLSEVFEASPELRQLAARLAEGARTPRERLDRIYRYVAQEIRYQQDYEDSIAGVRPHSCPVVLERGYGDCKDKAVLMILLGREVGLDLHFAVLRTTRAGRVFADVPNQQFNHAIVYVPAQEGIEGGFFVDPTTDGLDLGNLRADDQGATALVLDPDDGAWEMREIPYQEPERTFFRCDVDVEVAGPEEAAAEVRCRLRGQVAARFRRTMRNAERAAQLRQNLAHTIFAGSTVTDASSAHVEDIDAPLELRLTLDASAALQPRGAERRMPVSLPFTLGRLTRLERRRTPLRLGPPDSARWRLTYRAPRGGRIVRVPEDFAVEHPCFALSRRTETRGRTATVTYEYARTCAEVSPEDYPELRRRAQRAANQLEDDVVVAP
jgi:transglutaminase-like putative cysteine protease